mmetsp:Transcript_7774/g.24998  ORF Transcript_7774/g.24998 Transcript_7774/m.24998 type:complete len:157 (-) Transcript_7774:324-794(-)
MWWPKLSLFAPPLRVAVVGAGAIGGEFALRHFGRLTGTSVVGVVDCNEAAARSLASSVGCPSFTSLREALEACDPELIYIGTPPSTHRELVEASLAATCSSRSRSPPLARTATPSSPRPKPPRRGACCSASTSGCGGTRRRSGCGSSPSRSAPSAA